MGNILSLRNVTKTFPGVLALNNVSLDIEEGEVHALIGENGAGKSTLIKIITGAISPDDGTISYAGKEYNGMTPIISRALGIEAIYQEFNLAPTLTVAENIFMGERLGKGPILNKKKLNQRAQEILNIFGVSISPTEEVKNLSVARMQIVEISKAIARNARLLIMDEPTAPLTDNEVEMLFGLIEKLKKKGVTIIYISHRLNELFRVSDRVTVMRDGMVVDTRKISDYTKEGLIFDMVGRELNESFPKREIKYGDEKLRLENVSGNGVSNISFSLKRGEVLGIAGLVGAGRTELARLIFGAEKIEGGKIFIDSKPVRLKSPKDAVGHGIGLLVEDRKTQGLFLGMSIRWNETVSILKRLSNFLVINRTAEKNTVKNLSDSLMIKMPSIEQLVGNLSGGNQQKVAIAKWLASKSKILIFDEPTRGIDVGAKHEIYQLINSLADEGIAIIIISSEMEEILGMTDRLMVLSEGKVAGFLEKEEFSQAKVLSLASGDK